MRSDNRTRLWARSRNVVAVAGLLLLVAAVALLVRSDFDIVSLAALGYPGVAIVMFLTSSTIFLPAPGFAAVLAAGTVWNPLLVGVAAGLGAATGELSGYLLGASGGTLLDMRDSKQWGRAKELFATYGLWAVLLLAAIPNPLFDALGIIAGSFAYPVRRFWVACLIGKVIKFTAMAYLADSAVGWWYAR